VSEQVDSTAHVARSTVRLTVVGAGGRVDLVVPLGVRVADLGRAYVAELSGLVPADSDGPDDRDGDVELRRPSGGPLDPARTLLDQGLRHGDLVVVAPGSGGGPVAARGGPGTAAQVDSAPDPAPDGDAGARADGAAWAAGAAGTAWAAWAVPLAGVAAGATAAGLPPGPARTGCVLVLAVTALLALFVPGPAAGPADGAGATGRPATGDRAGAPSRVLVAPALVGSAAFLTVFSPGPGQVLLAVAVAALSAGAAAAVGRSLVPPGEDEAVTVWVTVAAVVAGLASVLLLAGAPAAALWPLLFAPAVLMARMLPPLVVDVPDQALLDIDRLAVTAWSARDQARGPKRQRTVIRPEQVTALVHRGHRLVGAGVTAIVAVVTVTAVLVLLPDGTTFETVGRQVMLVSGAVALLLVGRSYRARGPRRALRVAGAVTGALVVLDALLVVGAGDGSSSLRWWVSAGCVAVGVVVVLVGVSVGRGYRSVWWARAGDVTEGLALAVTLAAVPAAVGLADVARGLVA
jgi:hypothetical protein